MPEEPLNDEQQSEPTPHFDAFSGHSDGTETESTQTPNFNSNPEPSPITTNIPETPAATTPVQDGPMTSFAPNPVVNPESTINPEQARVPEGLNVTPQPAMPVIGSEKPKWFKQKKFIVGIVVVVLLALIGGGSAFAYFSYQNPQKVISDAVINAVTAKTSIYTGTLNVNSKDLKVGVNITSKLAGATGSLDADLTITASGKTYKIGGSGLVDNSGDLYFKVNHLAGIVGEIKITLGISQTSSESTAIDQLVAKIDDTWVKVSSNDLKQYSEDTATSKTCINDTVKKFKDDKSAIAEVTDLYAKNPFILVDKALGQVNGSFGYQLKESGSNLKTFLDGLKNTKIYKSLHDCDKTFVIDTNGMSTKDEVDKNGTVKLWVDVWSHQITKVELNGTDSGTTSSATILPKYNQKVTITAPAKSITLTQLQAYIQDLFTSMYGSQL
jgi:hypothetical protein